MTVVWQPSPNHGPRVEGKPVDILLLHYTGMPSAEGSLRWLCDPRSLVSAHYFIFEDGRVVQMVDETRRAWHAGVSFWAGETDINTRSIGIEIANAGPDSAAPEFPEAQIDAAIELCRAILARHPIPAHRVLAHSDVAPERKQDPGPFFPWRRLAAEGVGLWPVPGAPSSPLRGDSLAVGAYGPAVRELQSALAALGYRAAATGVFDWQTELVVTAFQRHFRAGRIDGVADAETVDTLDRVRRAMAG